MKRDENMHNKKNVVIMFLLIMLSFAIISEVSAASDAEIDGTGSNPSMENIKINQHGLADMDNRNFMQNHNGDVIGDDFKSHNGQNSFNQTPDDLGDNKCDKNSYEQNDMTSDDRNHQDFNEFDHDDRFNDSQEPMKFNHDDKFDILNKSNAMSPMEKPMDNATGKMDMFKPEGNMTGFDMFKPDGNNAPADLRNNESFNVPKGELGDGVDSNLKGMGNISPNFNKDDKLLHNDMKPNESAPLVPDEKKSSDMWKDSIKKSDKHPEVMKKTNKNIKKTKTSKKTVKKSKKPAKKLSKKFKKERAKL